MTTRARAADLEVTICDLKWNSIEQALSTQELETPGRDRMRPWVALGDPFLEMPVWHLKWE